MELVRGRRIFATAGTNHLKKLKTPKKASSCFTVAGRGYFWMVATLEVG
jgi:hypothetical protein